MAGKPEDLKDGPAKDVFMLVHEDDPRVLAERSVNRLVHLVMSLEQQLRQARADERRARAELGRLSAVERGDGK